MFSFKWSKSSYLPPVIWLLCRHGFECIIRAFHRPYSIQCDRAPGQMLFLSLPSSLLSWQHSGTTCSVIRGRRDRTFFFFGQSEHNSRTFPLLFHYCVKSGERERMYCVLRGTRGALLDPVPLTCSNWSHFKPNVKNQRSLHTVKYSNTLIHII